MAMSRGRFVELDFCDLQPETASVYNAEQMCYLLYKKKKAKGYFRFYAKNLNP